MRRRGRHRSRRGGTLGGVLATLSIVGVLAGVAIILAPRYTEAKAAGEGLRPEPARHQRHQTLIEELAALISRSVGVLAVHDRGATPFYEVLLWLTDDAPDGRRGRPDPPELAVLGHSDVLRTITVYRMSDPRAEAPSAGRLDDAVSPASPAFCNRFRADPRVEPLVVAGGVSDMRLEPVGERQDEWERSGKWGGFQRLRLTLTWAPDSADGPDAASVVIDTVIFPPPGG